MHGTVSIGLPEIKFALVFTAGLLGRWRPISGHFRHARLANRASYWLRRVEEKLARNSTRHHPESLMKYPG
jgi:hypothetical protein